MYNNKEFGSKYFVAYTTLLGRIYTVQKQLPEKDMGFEFHAPSGLAVRGQYEPNN